VAKPLRAEITGMARYQKYQRVKYLKNQRQKKHCHQQNQKSLKTHRRKQILMRRPLAKLEMSQRSDQVMVKALVKSHYLHAAPLQATQKRSLHALVTRSAKNSIHARNGKPIIRQIMIMNVDLILV
jgi:hypothetical protein